MSNAFLRNALYTVSFWEKTLWKLFSSTFSGFTTQNTVNNMSIESISTASFADTVSIQKVYSERLEWL